MNFLNKKKMAVKPLSKAITDCFATLDKRYGEKVAMLMGDSETSIDTISSGRPDLDVALGGGYGTGKIIEIFADSGTGKTGLCLEAVREVQEAGGRAAYIDSSIPWIILASENLLTNPTFSVLDDAKKDLKRVLLIIK